MFFNTEASANEAPEGEKQDSCYLAAERPEWLKTGSSYSLLEEFEV